ncbi:MAG: hydroxyacid dehydrogenase [Gammaproteobacteria bacterium]|nr:hydroxyacid dehydrogenase [Gammaproteobacteria bacterium]
MQEESLCIAFESIVGKHNCITNHKEVNSYIEDWRGNNLGFTPIVLLPNSTKAISQIIKICFENDIAVIPQGGNTGLCGAHIPNSTKDRVEIVINSSKMNQILELDIYNQTLIAQSGCVLSSIQNKAEENGLLFPLSLGAEGTCQIGGNISTNAGGVNVLKYGMSRELVMGIEVVLPDGTIFSDLKGLRKDNTGYDLKQLFIGAEGTLGFITAVCLKLFSLPKEHTTALVAVENPYRSIDLLRDAKNMFGDNLNAFEIMNKTSIETVEKQMSNYKIPLDSSYPWQILIEIGNLHTENNEDERMANFLGNQLEDGNIIDAVIANSGQDRIDFWNIRHAIPTSKKLTGPGVNNDVSVPISKIPELIDQSTNKLHQILGESPLYVYGHVGDGNLHITKNKPEDMDIEKFESKIDAITRMVNEIAVGLEGSYSGEHGIGLILKEDFMYFSDPIKIQLMEKIKNSIDPKNIMNPKKLIG